MFIPALISVSSLGMLFVAVLGPIGLVNARARRRSACAELDHRLAGRPATGRCRALIAHHASGPGLGFTAVLFAARLSAIDEEIYAAAELDGANHWQKMWRVAFPIVPRTTSACSRCCSTCGRCSAPPASSCMLTRAARARRPSTLSLAGLPLRLPGLRGRLQPGDRYRAVRARHRRAGHHPPSLPGEVLMAAIIATPQPRPRRTPVDAAPQAATRFTRGIIVSYVAGHPVLADPRAAALLAAHLGVQAAAGDPRPAVPADVLRGPRQLLGGLGPARRRRPRSSTRSTSRRRRWC